MTSLSQSITSIRTRLDNAEKEVKSLECGKKASSARARKSLQNIKTNCHSLRKNITEHTKSIPIKSKCKIPETIPETVEETVEELPDPPKLEREQTMAKPKRVRKKKE